jgi:hypothetical protein
MDSTLAPPGSTPVTTPRQKVDLTAATFMDVAVLRCLFLKNWQEEGVYWALQFLYHRYTHVSPYTLRQGYMVLALFVDYVKSATRQPHSKCQDAGVTHYPFQR